MQRSAVDKNDAFPAVKTGFYITVMLHFVGYTDLRYGSMVSAS
jgi:hypothetical protein